MKSEKIINGKFKVLVAPSCLPPLESCLIREQFINCETFSEAERTLICFKFAAINLRKLFNGTRCEIYGRNLRTFSVT